MTLPDGRLLVIRRADATDIDPLIAFYRALPLEDRYFRFFTGGMPPRAHFETIIDPARHGVVLVVEVVDGDVTTLVGDACYMTQPDGAGELAVTIAPSWRGWLGPYLLDALLEAAAANGIDTLEAEILVHNRPMLALVRARGCVTIGDDDLSKVRVALGTSSRVPSWPLRDGRRRVLVEAANPRWRFGLTSAQPAVDVRVCPGPPARLRGRCPMLSGQPCPLASEADAIVVAGTLDDALARELIDAHVQTNPDVPLFIEGCTAESAPASRELRSLPRSLSDAEVAKRLSDAIDETNAGEAR